MTFGEAAQAFGGGLFLVTSLVIGVRLLHLAWRNRTLPELLLGIAFFVGAGLGAVLEAGSMVALETEGPERVAGLIDAEKLARWMDAAGLPGAGAPISTRFVSGGASNEIFELRRGGQRIGARELDQE